MHHLRSTLRAFLIALLATAVMETVRRVVFVALFDYSAAVMPMLLAVMAAAAISGLRSGLFAIILGVGTIIYVFSESTNIPVFATYRQLRILMFVITGGLISWGLGTLHTARRRLADRQRELEREVSERRNTEANLASEIRRRCEAETALKEREERTRLAVESAEIGTWDFDVSTAEVNSSARCKLAFGFAPDAEVSLNEYVERVHPEDRDRMRQAMRAALDPAGNGVYDIDYRTVWPDGTIQWLIVRGQAFFDGETPHRRAARFVGTVLDVTGRKQVEAALRASEKRLQAILDNTTAVIYLKDLQGRFLMANRRFEDLSSHHQIVEKTDADLFPSDVVEKIQANDRRVICTGKPLEFEEVVPQSDGLHTYIAVKFPIFDAEGNVAAVGGISTDISDRKRAHDALKAEREMLWHTIEVQDQERRILTYEIHDGLVQYATGALMHLEALRGRVKSDTIAEEIERVVAILRKTVEEGRRIISGIHATVLDDYGIVAALQDLIESREQSPVQFELVTDERLGRMAHKTEQALYRITQEALTNVQKHSQSKKVRVELSRCGDHVHLEVRDWGMGISPAGGSNGGYGLKGMNERARLAGGKCTIEAVPGGGTQVSVELPYLSRN